MLGNREREPALNKSFLSRYMHQIEGTEGLRIFYLDVQTKYYYYCIKPWIDFITAMEDQIYTLSLSLCHTRTTQSLFRVGFGIHRYSVRAQKDEI